MRTAQTPRASKQQGPAKSSLPGGAISRKYRLEHPILHLQQAIGNQAIQQLMQSKTKDLEARPESMVQRTPDDGGGQKVATPPFPLASSKCGCTGLPEFQGFYPEVGHICHAKACAPAVLLDNTHICLSEGDQIKVLEITRARTKDGSMETWLRLSVLSGTYKDKTVLMRDRFVDFCSPEEKRKPPKEKDVPKKTTPCSLPFRVLSDSGCGGGDDFKWVRLF